MSDEAAKTVPKVADKLDMAEVKETLPEATENMKGLEEIKVVYKLRDLSGGMVNAWREYFKINNFFNGRAEVHVYLKFVQACILFSTESV